MSLVNAGLTPVSSPATDPRKPLLRITAVYSKVLGVAYMSEEFMPGEGGPSPRPCPMRAEWAVNIQKNWLSLQKEPGESTAQHPGRVVLKIQGNSPLGCTGTGQGEEKEVPGNEHEWEALAQSKLGENLR